MKLKICLLESVVHDCLNPMLWGGVFSELLFNKFLRVLYIAVWLRVKERDSELSFYIEENTCVIKLANSRASRNKMEKWDQNQAPSSLVLTMSGRFTKIINTYANAINWTFFLHLTTLSFFLFSSLDDLLSDPTNLIWGDDWSHSLHRQSPIWSFPEFSSAVK